MLEAPVVAHKSTGGPGGEQACELFRCFPPNIQPIPEIQENNHVNFILVIMKLYLQRKYIHQENQTGVSMN